MTILVVDPGEQHCKEKFLGELTRNSYQFFLVTNSSPRILHNNWHYRYIPPDSTLAVDFRHPEQAALFLKNELKSRGVAVSGVTTYYEEAVLITQAIALELSLIPITTGDPLALRNKSRMRQCFAAAGLPQPKSITCRTIKDAENAVKELGCPCVVKPSEMTASVGVRKISTATPAEIRDAFNAANTEDITEEDTRYAYNINTDVIVEEYIPTYQEISCEGIVQGGVLRLIAITKKQLSPEPLFDELGHATPYDVSCELKEILIHQLRVAARALQLHSTSFHAEFRLTQNDEPVLVELGARLPGGFIPQLVKLSQGIDMLAGSLQLASGQPFDSSPCKTSAAAIRFLITDEFVHKFRSAANHIRSLPFVNDLALYDSKSDGRRGHIIWTGRDLSELEQSWALINAI